MKNYVKPEQMSSQGRACLGIYITHSGQAIDILIYKMTISLNLSKHMLLTVALRGYGWLWVVKGGYVQLVG